MQLVYAESFTGCTSAAEQDSSPSAQIVGLLAPVAWNCCAGIVADSLLLAAGRTVWPEAQCAIQISANSTVHALSAIADLANRRLSDSAAFIKKHHRCQLISHATLTVSTVRARDAPILNEFET